MSEHVEPGLGATIGAAVVRELVGAVERAGASRDEFLRAAELDSERLDAAENRYPRAQIRELVDLAFDQTGDEAFGVHWAETLGSASFVPLSPLIAHVRTMRIGFEALAQFHRVLNDQSSFAIEEGEEEVTARCVLTLGDSPRLARFSAEMVVGGLYRLIRSFSANAKIERVCFAYPAPSYAAEYTRVFQDSSVQFDQPYSGLVFNRALMDAPAPHKDDDVHQALYAVAERRLLRIEQRRPYAVRVREVLLRERWPQRVDMSSVARSLGISERSLRRRLASEGTSYGEAVNQALAMVAKQALRDKRITIQETAYQMGFSDASTFHRAFKSWTGMTPGAYREAPDDEQAGSK